MNAPYERTGARVSNDIKGGVGEEMAFIAHVRYSALAASDTDGVHAAVTDTGATQTITTNITNPDYPRVISATVGGTVGDIKAIQVIVTGTNYAGDTITEALPEFTENTAGTVIGSCAFKTITSITIPAHDGTGATTAIGWINDIGLPYKLPHSTLIKAVLGGLSDSGIITSTDSELIEYNFFTPNGTPDGNADLDLYLIV